MSEKIERNRAKNVNITYKVLVLGVPNTGKSTLINMLCGSKKAATGNIAGVTRANSWLKIDDMFIMLDTPGVLWPKFDDGLSRNLAYVGSLSDKEFDMSDMGFELIQIIYEKYPNLLKDRFDVDYNFVSLEIGDKILMCSDGLTNFVEPNEILETLKENLISAVKLFTNIFFHFLSLPKSNAFHNNHGDVICAAAFICQFHKYICRSFYVIFF